MFANNNHLVIYHQATLVLQVFVNLYSAMQLLLVVVLNLLSEICHLLSSSRWSRTTLLTCTVPQRIYRQTVANPTEKKHYQCRSCSHLYSRTETAFSYILLGCLHSCFYNRTALSSAVSHLAVALQKTSLSAPTYRDQVVKPAAPLA